MSEVSSANRCRIGRLVREYSHKVTSERGRTKVRR